MKKRTLISSLCAGIILSACSSGTSSTSTSSLTLEQVLQDNLTFFQSGAGVDAKTFMPYDTIYVDKNSHKITSTNGQFNTTETGLYLNILLLIAEGNINSPYINKDQAVAQMLVITQELLDLQNTPGKSWKGLFYWPYNIESNGNIAPATSTIPDVDNSNLDFSLAALIGAYQYSSDPLRSKIAKQALTIVNNQQEGWTTIGTYTKSQLPNPDCQQCVAAGWDTATDKPLGYYIDRMANESRLSPLWMLIQGYTTESGAFTQMPIYSNNITLNNGESVNAELTWDGTMFQLLLPRILMREDQLIPNYSQLFNNYVTVQQQYIESNNIIAFLSASSATNDTYHGDFGVPSLNECYVRGWCQLPAFIDGTPHATALVALENPTLSIQYFNKLYQCSNTLTPYGLYDAIGQNCETGTELISLDQGMLVLGLTGNTIANYVGDYIKSLGKWEMVQGLYQHYQPVPFN